MKINKYSVINQIRHILIRFHPNEHLICPRRHNSLKCIQFQSLAFQEAALLHFVFVFLKNQLLGGRLSVGLAVVIVRLQMLIQEHLLTSVEWHHEASILLLLLGPYWGWCCSCPVMVIELLYCLGVRSTRLGTVAHFR